MSPRPERHYLLKGIIRCAYCGMPMWSQTYTNGQRYYREHKASRSLDICKSAGGSIPCHVADEQVKKLVSAIELGPNWLNEVLSIISLKDEAERVKKERQQIQEKLRRMAKAYIDGLLPDEESVSILLWPDDELLRRSLTAARRLLDKPGYVIRGNE